MNKRIAVIGIALENRKSISLVNGLLSSFSDIIVGRMGVPYREKEISVISLIVDGTTDEIGSLTGKLGNINGVKTKVAIMN